MKTKNLFLISVLFSSMSFFAITAQAQNSEQIDDIQFQEMLNGNLIFAVYTTILGGIDEYTIEYESNRDDPNEMILYVNILCTQKNPTGSYCQIPTTFAHGDNFFKKIIISVKVRSKTGGTEQNPIFSDYRLIDSKEIPLPDYGDKIYWIQLQEITEDSLLYDVVITTSVIGEEFVEYEEDGSNINVNILLSQIDMLLCYCFRPPIKISIKKDNYRKAIITLKTRQRIAGGSFENPVFSDYGLVDSKEIDLPVTNTTVIQHNPVAGNDINISPNPVKNTLYVDLREERKISFKIYNLQGSLLLDKNITDSQNIDVSFLNSGLYFVVVDNKCVHKLIKE